ncbi:hypothetical protein L484_018578 [Morus notabilis]|uniref:Uncharacterized protein n=1 Tax=Morus notabilis TaxID=981085 RepID=W9RVN1_9ROSA|nr:hypothetical protein L484_018578 [Morus notabilis]
MIEDRTPLRMSKNQCPYSDVLRRPLSSTEVRARPFSARVQLIPQPPWAEELRTGVIVQMPTSTSGAGASSEQRDEEEDPEIEAIFNELEPAPILGLGGLPDSHVPVNRGNLNLGSPSRHWTISDIYTASPTMSSSWPLGHPKSYRVLVRSWILWMKKLPRMKDWYYIQEKNKEPNHDEVVLPTWGMAFSWSKMPFVTKDQLRKIKKILDITVEDRHYSRIITVENIKKYKWFVRFLLLRSSERRCPARSPVSHSVVRSTLSPLTNRTCITDLGLVDSTSGPRERGSCLVDGGNGEGFLESETGLLGINNLTPLLNH